MLKKKKSLALAESILVLFLNKQEYEATTYTSWAECQFAGIAFPFLYIIKVADHSKHQPAT